MNTYKKFCPNVFIAVCEEEHDKGEEIILTTRRGKENRHIVHNFLGYLGTDEKPKYCYSITRADGMTHQDFKKRKAERIKQWEANANKRALKHHQASNEGREFLALGEPIKVGHHSEKRHKNLIERNWKRMEKSVAETRKAEQYNEKAKYWESKANEINLSMPESLEFYQYKLEEAKKTHKFLKDNPNKRSHAYALTYANKKVKETKDKLNTAVKLWGDEEEQQNVKKP